MAALRTALNQFLKNSEKLPGWSLLLALGGSSDPWQGFHEAAVQENLC